MKVIVYHSMYGCETGCCGHTVEVTDDDGHVERQFEFGDYFETEGTPIEWAKELVRSEFGHAHVADLDWENCQLLDINHTEVKAKGEV